MYPRWKPNVTVAAVIACQRDGSEKFLLVEEETRDGLKLNNPAGHLDPGESPVDACIRETLEETAFAFLPGAVVGVYLSRFERSASAEEEALDITYLRFAFCGALGEFDSSRALDHGIVRTLWLSADEIRAASASHRSPLLMRCVDDYLAGKRYPIDLITTDPSVLLRN